MKKHAYLIMAFNEFHMLKKLLKELDDERNDIFLHIDLKTKYVDEGEISSWVKFSNLHFVKRMKIYWGTLSIVKCELNLLEEALKGDYSYFHLISGVDFPLKSQDYIHELLANEDGEFFCYHSDGEFGDNFMYKMKYYHPLLMFVGKGVFEGCGKKQRFMRKLNDFEYKLQVYQERLGIDRTKKYPGVTFYKGGQWFSITRDFAECLVENRAKILKMYFRANGPDELFVPTLALNSEYADRVRGWDLRAIDWDRGCPYEYKYEDLDELKNSEAAFARKISYNREPMLVNGLIDAIHPEDKRDEHPLISVIVPCYNVEKYLEECVESLLAQTYKNLEIILVDDGATDNTGTIAKRYADEYEQVRYVCRDNGGLSAARNTGIENAKGEFLAFVDSDDYVDKDYISRLYDAIYRSGADISVCGFKKEEMETDRVSFDEDKVISPHAAMKILGDIYPKENVLLVLAWNKLYNKKLFEHVRYPEGKIHEDEFTAHRVIGQASSIALVTDCLYHYRIREGSITAGEKAQNLNHLDIMEAFKDRIDYSENMFYGDLLIYMLYAYFEGIKVLIRRYDEKTMAENGLYSYFSKAARMLYIRYFKYLDSNLKKECFKLICNPKKYAHWIKNHTS